MRRLVIIAASTARNPPNARGKIRAENAYARYQFERRREYARKFADGWLIFSAKWGLLAPGDEIDPTYVADQIEVTEDTLVQQLRRHHAENFDVIEVLAGEGYVERLRSPARQVGVRLSAPLIGQGLGMGRQSAEIHHRVLMGEPFSV